MGTSFNWTCPYCNRDQTVVDENYRENHFHCSLSSKRGSSVGLASSFIRCANIDCKELSVHIYLGPDKDVGPSNMIVWGFQSLDNLILSRRILPGGGAKPLPGYIPAQLREDYSEACAISELSPKAAATLARRCLQGMVRDFGQVRPSTLFKEIEALEKAVELGTAPRDVSIDSIAALTSVRKIGNIGAHMEADVDTIVPIEAGEARVLLDLIEALFDEWYVERHKRTQRFAALADIQAEKERVIREAAAKTSE